MVGCPRGHSEGPLTALRIGPIEASPSPPTSTMAGKAKARFAPTQLHFVFYLTRVFRTMIIRMISTAQTGFFYTTQRLRQGPRLSAVKYDPRGAPVSDPSLTESNAFSSKIARSVRREQEDIQEVTVFLSPIRSQHSAQVHVGYTFIDPCRSTSHLHNILFPWASFHMYTGHANTA